MKTIEEYIKELREIILKQNGDLSIIDEYQSHLFEELRDYALNHPEPMNKPSIEHDFVKTIESPKIIANSLLIGYKYRNKIQIDIDFMKRLSLIYFLGMLITLGLFLISTKIFTLIPDGDNGYDLFFSNLTYYTIIWPMNLIPDIYYGLLYNQFIGFVVINICFIIFLFDLDKFEGIEIYKIRKEKNKLKLGQLTQFYKIYLIAGFFSAIFYSIFIIFIWGNASDQILTFLYYLIGVVILWPILPLFLDISAIIMSLPGYVLFGNKIYQIKRNNSISKTKQNHIFPSINDFDKKDGKSMPPTYRIRYILRWLGAYLIITFFYINFIFFNYWWKSGYDIKHELRYIINESLFWPQSIILKQNDFQLWENNFTSFSIFSVLLILCFFILIYFKWERIFILISSKKKHLNNITKLK
ncbi:MAG: hypothetical protein ACXAC7_10230 [Candidatus Hodarchaeales archaeon]|jgi:hypothetical protein